MEFTWQDGERSSPGAFVIEGRHRFRQAEIKYAGWAYGDDFIDLTAGSKAAGVRHGDYIEQTDFNYSTKRSGQEGALLKTVVDLNSSLEFANSMLYASFNSDTVDIQWLSELNVRFSQLTIGGDFLTKTQKRISLTKNNETTKRQARLVARYKSTKLYLRTHVGYNTETAEKDYLSFFTTVQYKLQSYIRIELWSNLTEIDHREGRINYWYAFVKNSFQVAGDLMASVKLMHRYSRSSSLEHRTEMSFDLTYVY